MSERQMAIEGYITLATGAIRVRTPPTSGTWRTPTLTPGDYHAYDLAAHLQAQAQLETGLGNVTFSIDSQGRLVASATDGSSYELEFLDATLEAWSRMSTTETFSQASPATGSRAVLYAVYPGVPRLELRRESQAQSKQGRTDTSYGSTLYYGALVDFYLTLRLLGCEEDDAWRAYFDMVDFIEDYASTGKSWRAYMDTTVRTAYARVTNRLGYHTFRLHKDSHRVQMSSPIPELEELHDINLRCFPA